MKRFHLVPAFTAVLLSSCSGSLPQRTPTVQTPQGAFVEASSNQVKAEPVVPAWWRLFDSAELDQHVQRALSANTDLRVAVGNLQAARGAARTARSAQLPRAGVESGVGPVDAVDQPSTTMIPTTDYDIGGTISYEIDFFGRVRSSVSAAQADAEASQALLDAARVTVVADTVLAYVDLCGVIANERLASESVGAQKRSSELVSLQKERGEVSGLELAQAQAQLRRMEATLPVLQADRRRALYRLAVLQGVPPSDADRFKIRCLAPPKLNAQVPVGDGAALIARRPDIREAERRLAAATSRIGAATAEYYPRITLGGSAGLIAGASETFFTPLINWAFLDFNAVRGKVEAAKGTEAAALAKFDAAILRALQEVESTLADYRAEYLRHRALEDAARESEQAATRARTRYRLGADSYIVALDAERVRADSATQLSASDIRLAQIQVQLFRALGGGWEMSADKR